MCFTDQERMDLWHDLEHDRELMTRDGKYYVASGVLMNRNLEQLRTIDELTTENMKLRELVRDMWHDIPKTESCEWNTSSNTCDGADECNGECAFWHRMVELGIKEER